MKLQHDEQVRAALPLVPVVAATTAAAAIFTMTAMVVAIVASPTVSMAAAASMPIPWLLQWTWLARRLGSRLGNTVADFWRWMALGAFMVVPGFVALGMPAASLGGVQIVIQTMTVPISCLSFTWAIWLRRRSAMGGSSPIGFFDMAVPVSAAIAYASFLLVVPVFSVVRVQAFYTGVAFIATSALLAMGIPMARSVRRRGIITAESLFVGMLAGLVFLTFFDTATLAIRGASPRDIMPAWLQGLGWAIVFGGGTAACYADRADLGALRTRHVAHSVGALWPYAVLAAMPPLAVAAIVVEPVRQKVAAVLGLLLVLEVLVARQLVLIKERREARERFRGLIHVERSEARRMHVLLDTATALAAHDDPASMCQTVANQVAGILPQSCGVLVVARASGRQRHTYVTGHKRCPASSDLRASWGSLVDLSSPAEPAPASWVMGVELHSDSMVRGFPVLGASGRVGTLAIVSPSGWSMQSADVALASGVVDQLALGLERAMLLSGLRHRRDRLRNVLDNIPEAIAELSSELRVLACNGSYAAILGTTPEELVGEVLPLDRLDPKEVSGTKSLGTHAGEVVGNVLLTHHDGSRREYEYGTMPLADATLVVLRDMTETQEQERRIVRLTGELAERDRSRAALLDSVVAAAEAQRGHVAQQLSGGVTPALSVLCLKLDAARTLAGVAPDNSYEARDLLVQSRKDLARVVAALRSLMVDLRPPVLDERGVGAAIEALARRVENESGVHIYASAERIPRLDDVLGTLVYRAAREGLMALTGSLNRGANSATQHAEVSLRCLDGVVQLEIIGDSGDAGGDVGVDAVADAARASLAFVAECVELAGGSVTTSGEPPGRTVLRVEVPGGFQ